MKEERSEPLSWEQIIRNMSGVINGFAHSPKLPHTKQTSS